MLVACFLICKKLGNLFQIDFKIQNEKKFKFTFIMSHFDINFKLMVYLFTPRCVYLHLRFDWSKRGVNFLYFWLLSLHPDMKSYFFVYRHKKSSRNKRNKREVMFQIYH